MTLRCPQTRFSVILIGLVLASGCGETEIEPHAQPRETPTENVKQVASDGNDFAFDLYGQLSSQEGNLFFSPYSISTALGMTYAGARGQTESEMAEVLHFTLSQDDLHAANGALMRDLDGEGKNRGYALNIANRLWGRAGDELLAEFREVNRRDYGAEFQQLDFGGDADAARKKINDWVAGKTNEKITELLKPGVINGQTVLVLTNAIYFKGNWTHQFKESSTREASFFLDAENSVDVPTMFQNEEFSTGENDLAQILEMPYEGEDLAMIILLPKKKHGLAEVEAQLSTENLTKWRNQMHKSEINVWLPKFTMTSQFKLNDTLSSMGMPSAFGGGADFSGITGNPGLYLSAVVHKAFVDVNEEGTEAAASTAVVVEESAMIPEEFRADHPFIFLIRDNQTGGVLFMGRVSDPRPQS